jgi:CheY-like chemotaxis protein
MNEIMPAKNVTKQTVVNKLLGNIFHKKVSPVVKTTSNLDITNDMTTYIRSLFHDLRGPLNNISLGIETLLQKSKEEDDDYEILKCIKDSCTFLGDSLNGFLCMNAFTPLNIHTTELSYEPFNMIGLIKKVQYILLFNIRDKKIDIECKIKPFQEWVMGDYKHIQFAILSLVTNIINNLKNKSKITIEIGCKKILPNKKQHIIIKIISDFKKRIYFKSFQDLLVSSSSSKSNGSNGRINICKSIIELHGGKLECYHKDDHNVSQIDLFLDMCPSSEKALDRIISSRTPSRAPSFKKNDLIDLSASSLKNNLIVPSNPLSMMERGSQNSLLSNIKKNEDVTNIMVIDDSDASRKLMMKLIQNTCNNVRLHDAIDGLDALVKFIKFSENDIPINMVLVDNVMPNLTGELLSKILRGVGYNGLIVGITANGVKEDRQQFENNGADYVFIKPFTKNNLLALLELIKRHGFLSREGKKIKMLQDGTLDWSEY